jgi:hypothetical protein
MTTQADPTWNVGLISPPFQGGSWLGLITT